MRRSLCRTFSRPERPTLTSRSVQSITRPFQKRFREVFGNARILIFYLSIKAWEEKSLPKSHLGWFFLAFGEGKATKENMSIFWFIWPLSLKKMPPKLCDIKYVPQVVKHVCHSTQEKHKRCLVEIFRFYIGLVESHAKEVTAFHL